MGLPSRIGLLRRCVDQIFAAQARSRAPLVRTICKALAGSADGNLRAGFFLDLLRRGFSVEEAQRQLDIAIDWGRYGELYDYDRVSDEITADPAAGIHRGSPVNGTIGAAGPG
jgi:NitT/TauT family transport system ATP-binding protein